MTYRYHIGIDPDVDCSGFAIWDAQAKKFERLDTIEFYDLLDYIRTCQNTKVHIEASWLIGKSVWHSSPSMGTASRIGMHVGANQQVGKLIEAYCRRMSVPCELRKPVKSKLKSDIFKKITGVTHRTNQEVRDAAMLVFSI